MASLVVAWTNHLQDEDGVTDQPVKLDEAHFLRVRRRRRSCGTASSGAAGHAG